MTLKRQRERPIINSISRQCDRESGEGISGTAVWEVVWGVVPQASGFQECLNEKNTQTKREWLQVLQHISQKQILSKSTDVLQGSLIF